MNKLIYVSGDQWDQWETIHANESYYTIHANESYYRG